jgi:glycine dehydrogenase subunit 1
MEVANASMYDGASACAEAVLMARRVTHKQKVLVSAGVHPEYLATVRTYLAGMGEEGALHVIPLDASGRTDLSALGQAAGDDTACVLVGYPNFLGVIEDLSALRTIAAQHGAQLISATSELYALSLIKAPGELGVDIAVAEGQSLSVPPQFGGPGVGLFACRNSAISKMPGRLCGETVDAAGVRGYVLTLSTREQHIRRERATSNICTNHGLIALSFAIRVAMIGKSGFRAVGELCLSKAEYLKQKIAALPGFHLPYAGSATFNEFVVGCRVGSAADVLAKLSAQGILGGVDLSRFDPARKTDFLVAVTERHTREDLDRFAAALASL